MINPLTLLRRGIQEIGPRPTWDAVRYQIRRLWYRLRFGSHRPPDPEAAAAYARPGPVTGYGHQDQTVTIGCANGSYLLTVLTPEMIRVRFAPGSAGDQLRDGADSAGIRGSYAIVRADDYWPRCEVALAETDSALELRTARLTCRIATSSGQLTFLDAEGAVINEDAGGAGHASDQPVTFRKRIQPDEHFYGLGERTCGLDRREGRFETWNTDPQVYALGQDPIYLCIPFILGLHSGGKQGYGILFDNPWRGCFDLGASDPDVASFTAVGGELCYTFIYGPRLAAVVERYTDLTGRMPLPPLWSLGYHQSRWSYYPEERVRQLAADFREVHDVPCDAIHLDIHYMDGYRCFTWDRERFPNPAGMLGDLHEQGFKTVAILDAGIKADPGYSACRSGLEEGVFCMLPNGRPVKGPVWGGDSYFPDFTAPGARAWWSDRLSSLVELGIDGIWNDMNEPALFGLEGTTLPDAVQHDLEGRGGDHAEAHNLYGLQMARATAEGLARLRPDQRSFSLTRSGWAGVQRYAVCWTGDNAASWEHLWLTLPMVLNLGLSGVAFTGSDVGGFLGHPSAELFTRWLQMGVFLPLLRAHTHLHDPDQEPWSWGEPYLSINRSWIERRYRLLPYLYTAAWQCAQSGLPIVRPLLLAFQEDGATHALDDQFLCGDHLLIAPILEEDTTSRSVYLPAGTWYDLWSDGRVPGPARVQVEAPLDRMPIFVQAGAVVPLGPTMSYVGEQPVDCLTLHVYPIIEPQEGESRAGQPTGEQRSLLYEDDGRTYAYRDGRFLLTRFALTAKGAPLTHLRLRRQTEGGYRSGCGTFEVVLHGIQRLPRAASSDGKPIDPGQIDGQPPALRLQVGLFKNLALEWD